MDQRERTIVFVDLAGFTALTEAHGDEVAADVAERLSAMTLAALGPQDRLVKTIGDAVMIASPDPLSGVEVLRKILAECFTSPDCPVARAGLHHGPVVSRGDDLFGNVVNLAARVAGQASGGQVLSTAVVADRARAIGVTVSDLGTFSLRNVAEPVQLFELVLHDQLAGSTVDPVCRMHVERSAAAGSFRHDGVNYWFCSLDCVATFTKHPERYAVSSTPVRE